MILWLVGMMGSGKTTAGMIAAVSLGVSFRDTDRIVEEEAGTTIAAIWESEGEEGFRARERRAVVSAAVGEGVVATGGGVVLSEANRSLMSRTGSVIWLDAPVEVLSSRLDTVTGRPLLAGPDTVGELSRIRTERAVLYRVLADHRIDTTHLTPEETAERIEELWRS